MRRQKIKIKKIEKKRSLEVTFSERRTGLFKKAGELYFLCSVEAAVIVFSPSRGPSSSATPPRTLSSMLPASRDQL
ncbi:Agamous-like MADS-box protein AGL62 [Vitis vinifera]|uniref:Agamous-like MADS-box protein AGL62 n=1 Tax=Vitis vinifera TaxID=29760 RepID=A0A438I6C1_VITVI|nr:Agamous-like MADS-box protein AGL62 [Vitis vinifera]